MCPSAVLDRLLNEYAAAAIDYDVKNREPTPEKELEVAFHRLLSARVAIEEYAEPTGAQSRPAAEPTGPQSRPAAEPTGSPDCPACTSAARLRAEQSG